MATWERKYPLHVLTWNNNHLILDKLLIDHLKEDSKTKPDLEKKDIRGRTPLHLAVTLGHVSIVEVLLRHGANVTAQNSQYWTVLQEAVSSGNEALVRLCMKYHRRGSPPKKIDVPALLDKLRQSPDFYVEMKWEFTSWVPLMSRMCPNDTYKIWKRGTNVRVDTTLLGFEGINWQRGNHSYLFKTTDENASVIELDHDCNQASIRRIELIAVDTDDEDAAESDAGQSSRDIDQSTLDKKMHTPLTNTFLDTENISFVRDRSGIYGFRQDKTEHVNGYEAKVFNAVNVTLVTKTRTEHLSSEDKSKLAAAKEENSKGKKALDTILAVVEREEKQYSAKSTSASQQQQTSTSKSNYTGGVTISEYFDPRVNLDLNRNIGHSIEQTTKTRSFSAHIWLAETYPLLLQEQLLPVIQLMSQTNQHFKRLHDFIVLQLPSGFPVKIEIPLFHILNARITFGNIFGIDQPVSGVNVSLQRVAGGTPRHPATKRTPAPSQSPTANLRPRDGVAGTCSDLDGAMEDIPLSSSSDRKNKCALVNVVKNKENSDSNREPDDSVLKPKCTVTESLFDIPSNYSTIGEEQFRNFNRDRETDLAYDQDEQLLQYALRQSLCDSSSNPEIPSNNIHSEEDKMLQRAIQASLSNQDLPPCDLNLQHQQTFPRQQQRLDNSQSQDQQLKEVIEASKLQQEKEERDRLNNELREEEILQEILKLSLQEK